MADPRKYRLARLGQEIARVREANGLSQEVLAQALGVHRVTVTRWETGAQPVDGNALAAIEDLFGLRLVFVEAEDAR